MTSASSSIAPSTLQHLIRSLHLHAQQLSRLKERVVIAGRRGSHDDPLDLQPLQVLIAERKEAINLLERQQGRLLEYLNLSGQ